MQSINITTNLKVKRDFTSSKLSATKIMTWNCHVVDSARGRYDMIFGRDLWTALGLNLKYFKQIIEEDDGPLKVLTAPMVDLGVYEYKKLDTGEITPE